MEYIDFVNEYQNAPYGQKTKVIEEWCDLLDENKDKLYAVLREMAPGSVQQRRTRSDRGVNRRYTQEEIDRIAEIKAKDPEGRLTTEDAVRIAIDMQLIDAKKFLNERGEVKVSSVDRHLRQKGYHLQKSTVRLQAEAANEVHAMDFSGSEYFEPVKPLEGDHDSDSPHFWSGNDWLLRLKRRKRQKNKNEKTLKLWYCGIKDDYSRKTHIMADIMTGESAVAGIHALVHAWGETGDLSAPLAVPRYLKVDNGAFRHARFSQSLIAGIPDLEWLHVQPGNKQANGKVENEFLNLWRWEARIAAKMRLMNQRTITLADLRDRLERYLHQLNTRAHPEKSRFPNMTRHQVYMQAMQGTEAVRLPADVLEHIHMSEYRTVNNDSKFSYKGTIYRAPTKLQGQRILVNCGLNGDIILEFKEKHYLAEEVEALPTGVYRGEQDPYRKQAEKVKVRTDMNLLDQQEAKIHTIHFGTERDVEISSPLAALKQQKYFQDVDEALRSISKRCLREPFQNMPQYVQEDIREILRHVKKDQDGLHKEEILGQVDMYVYNQTQAGNAS